MKNLLKITNRKFKNIILIIFLNLFVQFANAQISGTVFTDGNNNGIKDATEVGFPNATIKAYLTGSTIVATTTAANNGTYTLSGLTAGTRYRIEFIPFEGFTDGSVGAGSGSSIQFATSGSTNVNFGVFFPGKCGTDPDPRLIGSCGLFPDPLNPPATPPSISVASWRYQTDFYPQTKWGGFNYPTVQPHQDDLLATEVGVPWAMARIPSTNYVLMVPISSPETSVFGSGGVSGTSAIYMVDYSGTNAEYATHKTLVQLSSAGFPLTAVNPIGAVQPRFGEYGLGGIAVSADAKYVYVANLGKGNIMKIDISGVTYGSLPTTAPTAGNITEIDFPTSIAGFTSGVDGYFRATSMKRHSDDIYIAGTFDGSLRSDNSAVRIVVFKLNVATNALTEVFNFDPMTFDGGNINTAPVPQKRWTAGPDISDATIGGKETKYIQPVVSGFDFDNYGAITLGITNRGVYNLNTANEVGYVVSTWRNADGTYILESAGARGSLTTANSGTTMHETFNTGPGGDVFYDQSIGHPYLFSGGLLNITSKSVMAMGLTDPMMVQSFGVRYDQQSDGGIIGGIGLGGGKLFALVGVDAVCAIKDPIEVGNYIWKDDNANGIMDGNELAIAGVTVELVNSGGTVIATATTDANGYYIFSSDPNRTSTTSHQYNLSQLTASTSFKIRVPNATGGSIQAPLTALYVTLSNVGTSDLIDSDGSLNGTNAEVSFITGTEGQNNHSYDFGFTSTPVCTIPTAPTAAVITQATCNAAGTAANDDAKIEITGITNGTNYSVDGGATTAFTGGTISLTALPNPATSKTYTIKIWDTDATCFIEVTAVLEPIVCTPTCVPPSPTATGTTICAGLTATLTSTGCDATYLAKWYSDATLTTELATSDAYTTVALTATTDYYVACVKDATCMSTGVKVTVMVTPKPTAPTAAVVTQATCNAAGTAANDDAKIEITGITNGTNYSVDGGATTAFTGGTISLTALPNPATSKTYTIKIWDTDATCFIEVTAVLEPKVCTPTCVPPSPTAAGTTICAGLTATLTSTGCDASYLAKWYSDATLTTELATSDAYTTVALTATTDYYVACVKDATCMSTGVKVTVMVTPKPTAPTAAVVTQATCNVAGTAANDDAKIEITGITNGTNYSVDGGATTAFTGGTISLTALPNPATSKTYTIKIWDTDATCFIEVTAVLEPKVCTPDCTPPSPTAAGTTICEGLTATLTSTGCDATYLAKWYSDATLTTELATSDAYTTVALTATTDYYVACVKDATCMSTGVKVTVMVTPKPTAPTAAAVTQATCNVAGTAANDDAKIEITGITNGTNYSVDGGATTAFTGGTISLTALPNPATSKTYTIKIWDTDATCFIEVTAVLEPKVCTPGCPTIAQPADTTICAGSTVILMSTMTNITTQDIKFVYFNTHQTDPAVIYGTPDGVLGTVTNAELTLGKTKATLTATIPASPTSMTYHVYAILSPTPTDAACKPFGHRHVIVDPSKCTSTPCGTPECLGISVIKN